MSADSARLEEVLKALEKSSNRLDGLDVVREIITSSNSLPQGNLSVPLKFYFVWFPSRHPFMVNLHQGWINLGTFAALHTTET
jgi:hypothetical protein